MFSFFIHSYVYFRMLLQIKFLHILSSSYDIFGLRRSTMKFHFNCVLFRPRRILYAEGSYYRAVSAFMSCFLNEYPQTPIHVRQSSGLGHQTPIDRTSFASDIIYGWTNNDKSIWYDGKKSYTKLNIKCKFFSKNYLL